MRESFLVRYIIGAAVKIAGGAVTTKPTPSNSVLFPQRSVNCHTSNFPVDFLNLEP